jgi:DNA modification methylase
MIEKLKIILKETHGLKPYLKNARSHGKKQVAQIAASIKEFGFNNPILIAEDDEIIAGHGRLAAAVKLGLEKVPCIVLPHLTEAQRRAYVLADNKLAENSVWDEALLRDELAALAAVNFDLELVGFDQSELNKLLTPDSAGNGRDPDAVPEATGATVSKLGDIWLLGEHRVMCGDSTSAEDVATLMNGMTAKLLQTDPPYGIAYVANAKQKGQSVAHVDIENDDLDGEKLQAFLEATIKAALPHLDKKTAFYLWHPMLTQGTFFAAAAAADILISRQIIWVKPSMVFGRGDYHWQHELCFYGWVRGNKPPFYGERNQTTIWSIGRETSKQHPTAKPVDLWRTPMKNHTVVGEVIYEPFAGSGSQLIAAQSEGRVSCNMELSPNYVVVIVKRWQDFTGKKAVHAVTSVAFDECVKVAA